MNITTTTDLKKIAGRDLPNLSPIAVTFDGEVVAYIVKPEDVIIIGDLHPRVKKQFRAQEQKVRRGMANPRRIELDQLHDEEILDTASKG